MGVMMNEAINIEHEIHELALKIKEERISQLNDLTLVTRRKKHENQDL